MSKKTLPLYNLKINPAKGSLVSGISLVNSPAIGSNFVAFSQDSPTPQEVKFEANDERMELLGAAMIPGLPMYRNTPGVGEYIAVFEADTIRQIAQVFAEQGFFNNMNLDHKPISAGSYVFQSFIVDSSKGMPSPTGIDAPDGSWIVGVKVTDPDVWQDIKDGKRNGFSVEGYFNLFDTSIDIELEKLMNEFEAKLAEYFAEPKGCLMLFPEVDQMQWDLQAINTIPGAQEFEHEPHVTILYGFDATPDLDALRGFLTEALNVWPIDIMLGRISKFTGGENDVVKIEVCDCNGSLTAMNTILSEMFGVVSNYPEYHPHMTIGYITPDPELVFSADAACPWNFGINYLTKGSIIYSDAQGNKTEILKIK